MDCGVDSAWVSWCQVGFPVALVATEWLLNCFATMYVSWLVGGILSGCVCDLWLWLWL